MTSHFKNLNPLQVAIIDGNSDLVLKLRESKWRFEKDINGFSPLELADLLGKDQIQKLLVFRKPITIKLQQNDQNSPQLITAPQFEKIFNVVYRRCLTFTSYELLTEVIHECPYFFRVQWLFGKKDYLEAYYLECLLHQKEAKTFVKWIDPIFEYGLFADEDLLENTFIGQYSGHLRKLKADDSTSNAYCFYYPTRLFSSNYFAIDALYEGNLLRFVNHSDTPNLQPLWLYDRGLLHLCFIANQEIKKGTELTFNYGNVYWRHRKKSDLSF